MYGGHNQVWCAAQDTCGLLYFGGTSNIFTYDGVQWKHIPVRSGSAVRQLMYDRATQTMYVGCVGSFGYLDYDQFNQPHYVSISDSLPNDQQGFSDVWKLYSFNNKIYFQTSEGIYIVGNKALTGFIPAPKENTFALSFIAGRKMFVRQRGKGLMEVKGENLVPVIGGEKFGDIRILEIMPTKEEGNYYVLSGDQGAWLMHQNKSIVSIDEKPMFIDSFLVNSGVLGSKWVNDSVYIVHGRSGAAFYNSKGKVKETLDINSGLSDMTISYAFIDRERNLWLMHNFGISCVDYNKGIYTFNSIGAGFKGALETMTVFNDKVYLATTEGISVSPYPYATNKLHFKSINMPMTEVWDLKVINNELYGASGNGLFKLTNDKAVFINNHYCVQLAGTNDPAKFIVLEKNGVQILRINKNGFPAEMAYYEGSGLEFINATSAKQNGSKYELWTSTRFREFIHFSYDTLKKSWETHIYDTSRGFTGTTALFPAEYNGEVYFCTSNDCYKYIRAKDKDSASKCFEKDLSIIEHIYDKGIDGIDIYENYRLFFSRSIYSRTIFFGKNKDGNLISQEHGLGELFGEDIQVVYADHVNRAWALGPEQIRLIDLKAKTNSAIMFQALITHVYIGGDSLIFSTYDRAADIIEKELDYSNNNVSLKFAAPFFDRSDVILYVYTLEGFDKKWSDTLYVNEKEYTNLPEGTYTFRVKAKNVYGQIAKEASVTFTILPPWYRSVLAYVIYAFLFVGLIWIVIKVSNKRLIQNQLKLEQIIKERTTEVVQQKHLIEEKHKEITDSINYAERIQRSFLATKKLLDLSLKDYFVLFQPKDVVSGDFYWGGKLRNGNFALMVADSTGHGVPGAIMSILNISSVEKAVEQGVCEPAEILNKTRKTIIERLNNDGSEDGGKEGMDGSLISFNFEKKIFTYAAAYNPIIVIRANELIELKADKMPIGRHDRDGEPFSQHTFDWQSGDLMYVFTDGMPDQFGGPKGKKFMYKQMKKILQEISYLPIETQYQKLYNALVEWKTGYDQIDDICIVGVRL